MAAGRPPHRQVRLLQYFRHHVLIGATPTQPHGQPRSGTPVQLVEGAPIASSDAAQQLTFVEAVQTPSHIKQDDGYANYSSRPPCDTRHRPTGLAHAIEPAEAGRPRCRVRCILTATDRGVLPRCGNVSLSENGAAADMDRHSGGRRSRAGTSSSSATALDAANE